MIKATRALALYLAMSAGLLLQPLYMLPERPLFWLVLILLPALLIHVSQDHSATRSNWREVLLAAAAGGLLFIFPSSWHPAIILILVACLLGLLPGRWIWRFAQGLREIGLALFGGMLLVRPSTLMHAILQQDLLTGKAALWLGKASGMELSIVANNLVMQTPDEPLHFAIAPEWTGLHMRLIGLGFLIILVIRNADSFRQGLGRLLFRAPVYLLLSSAAFAMIFLGMSQMAAMHQQYEWAWDSHMQILFALPGGMLLAWLISAGSGATKDMPAQQVTHNWLPTQGEGRTWILAFASWALLLCALLVQDPGTRKEGRVLIDDGHSDWEWAGDPMNTWQFGTKSTYNYHGLGKLLKRYYQTSITKADITAALLDSTDVLILKTPTRSYSEEERRAIIDWVGEGGGLYVISDHTDIFGMSTFLNVLTSEFGFTYNKDTVFDLETTDDQFWAGYEGMPHPAGLHVPFYRYLTGCSIRPGWDTELVMTASMAGSDLLSYSTSNFFDTWYPRTEMRFGNLIQLVATRYGKGRVVGFSDSTTYSNFAMFLPGRLEHLISIVEFLNRRNSLIPWRVLLLLGALALAWAAQRKGGGPQIAAAGLALLFVFPLARSFIHSSYPWPEARQLMPTSTLDTLYSQVELPYVDKLEENRPLDMESFYIWQYRSGRIPELAAGSPTASSEVFTVINPGRIPTAQDQKNMDDFMRAGGTMLVAGSPGHIANGINAWLDRYKVGYVRESWRDTTVVHVEHDVPVFVRSAQGVKGGSPGYRIQFGTPVSTETPVGKGKLILSGLADCFSTGRLGRYDSVPSGLSYEYLQMYYRHTNIQTGRKVVAEPGRGTQLGQ